MKGAFGPCNARTCTEANAVLASSKNNFASGAENGKKSRFGQLVNHSSDGLISRRKSRLHAEQEAS